ncbi:hypothetical protein ABZ815_34655 [Nonomuraea sp. NPDC047529]|uniref:hypothetical protein n=1 Tax=Nonomuraea sp. NPDC047529 TaxID=3155623 RepID=UPI0033F844ED
MPAAPPANSTNNATAPAAPPPTYRATNALRPTYTTERKTITSVSRANPGQSSRPATRDATRAPPPPPAGARTAGSVSTAPATAGAASTIPDTATKPYPRPATRNGTSAGTAP